MIRLPICRQCDQTFPNRTMINGVEKVLNRRKFCLDCSPFGNHNTKPDVTVPTIPRKLISKTSVQKRRKEHQLKAVEYKGGKCEVCGYSRCTRALEFHHLEPSKKSFAVSTNWTRSWNILQAEIDKCALLCANCHREVEDGLITL